MSLEGNWTSSAALMALLLEENPCHQHQQHHQDHQHHHHQHHHQQHHQHQNQQDDDNDDDKDNGDDKDKVAATESDPFVPSLNGRSCSQQSFHVAGW